jgi:hypothetical protein
VPLARSLRSAAVAALLLALAASPAVAQSKGKGLGKSKKSSPPPSEQPDAPAILGTGVRQFGVWLDDATMLSGGHAWVTVGVGYWKSMYGHQIDAPTVDVALAVSDRFQIGLSAPYSRVSYSDGSEQTGLGDVYLTGKAGLVAPGVGGRSWGLAVAPVVEILSSGSTVDGQERVQWALPVIVERRFSGFRAYGAAGYFSRGALFGSAGLEVPLGSKVSATAALSYSHSTADDPLSDQMALSAGRWDLSAGAVYALNARVSLYGSVGRTVSQLDENASSLAVTAGVSYGVDRFSWRP